MADEPKISEREREIDLGRLERGGMIIIVVKLVISIKATEKC